jgi:thiamine-phosphate pyrophosphorylase
MIVLIAPEKDIKEEFVILNQFFEAGLDYFHLRKPSKNLEEYCAYIDQIDTKFHNKIVIHSFHELINKYNLKGIHFQEQKRRDCIDVPTNYFKGLSMYGKTISSSFHAVEDIANCEFEFDYHLLSPVFSSISKEGYEGKGFDVNEVGKFVIGMGGVSTLNLDEFTKLGFKGVGVLGGIWNSSTPIQSYKTMRNYFNQSNS